MNLLHLDSLWLSELYILHLSFISQLRVVKLLQAIVNVFLADRSNAILATPEQVIVNPTALGMVRDSGARFGRGNAGLLLRRENFLAEVLMRFENRFISKLLST